MLLRFAAVLERGERGWKRLERGHRRADLNAGADVENRLALLPERYETLGHTLERLDRAHAARAAAATILERIRRITAARRRKERRCVDRRQEQASIRREVLRCFGVLRENDRRQIVRAQRFDDRRRDGPRLDYTPQCAVRAQASIVDCDDDDAFADADRSS